MYHSPLVAMEVASAQPTAALIPWMLKGQGGLRVLAWPLTLRGAAARGAQYFTQTLCLESSIAQGQTIDKVVSVIDLTGVTMSNASNKHFIALFKQMSKIDSDNYPEVSRPHHSATTPILECIRPPPSVDAPVVRCGAPPVRPCGCEQGTRARCKWLGALTAVPPTHLPRLSRQVMKSVYIINAPWVFSAIFNLIKGFLDPSTQKKIKVCAPCRPAWVVVRRFAHGPRHRAARRRTETLMAGRWLECACRW